MVKPADSKLGINSKWMIHFIYSKCVFIEKKTQNKNACPQELVKIMCNKKKTVLNGSIVHNIKVRPMTETIFGSLYFCFLPKKLTE